MTPREKNLVGTASLVLATLVALGSVYAFAASRERELAILKTQLANEVKRLDSKDSDVIVRLDRIETKVDKMLERRR